MEIVREQVRIRESHIHPVGDSEHHTQLALNRA